MNEKEKYGIATACITKYLHIATIPFNLSRLPTKHLIIMMIAPTLGHVREGREVKGSMEGFEGARRS